MNAAAEAPAASIVVNESRLELIDRGRGRPILFLHPHIGLDPSAPVLATLAAGGRLIAPSHPGFGHSERPAGVTTVDDLGYFYLDLIMLCTMDTPPIYVARFTGGQNRCMYKNTEFSVI
jgi:pimeloyl-ACP methyl ester carboxylesterase